jgi:hypothetical protein
VSGSAEQDDERPAEVPASEQLPSHELRSRAPGLLDELLDVEHGESATAPAPGAIARATGLEQMGPLFGTRVGRLIAWPPGGAPQVEWDGNTRGPIAARSVIPLTPASVAEAIAEGRGVLLTFDAGRADAPIIMGVLQPLVHPEPSAAPASEAEGEAEIEAALPADATLDTHVDGRRVELTAADEIVLRCGEASIVLRRNGRVVIRGTYVETRSRGVNRIKGGSVEIN